MFLHLKQGRIPEAPRRWKVQRCASASLMKKACGFNRMRLTLPPTNLMSKPRSISWFNHKFKSAVVDWAYPETILSAVSLRKAARQIQASSRFRQSNSYSVFFMWKKLLSNKKTSMHPRINKCSIIKSTFRLLQWSKNVSSNAIVVVQAKGKSAVVFQQSFFDDLRKTCIFAKLSDQFLGVSNQERNLCTIFVTIKFYFLKASPKGL